MMIAPIATNANDNRSAVDAMGGDPVAYMALLSQSCVGIQQRLQAIGVIADSETRQLIRDVDDALNAIDEHLNSLDDDD